MWPAGSAMAVEEPHAQDLCGLRVLADQGAAAVFLTRMPDRQGTYRSVHLARSRRARPRRWPERRGRPPHPPYSHDGAPAPAPRSRNPRKLAITSSPAAKAAPCSPPPYDPPSFPAGFIERHESETWGSRPHSDRGLPPGPRPKSPCTSHSSAPSPAVHAPACASAGTATAWCTTASKRHTGDGRGCPGYVMIAA